MIQDIVTALPGFVKTAEGETCFTLRHGIRFGMTSGEVIRIERKNGFQYKDYDMDDGEALYDSGYNYQLNYQPPGANLGGLKLNRFEYDFTRHDKTLYQFYYGFPMPSGECYFPISNALEKKFGPATPDGRISEKFSSVGKDRVNAHVGWTLPDDESYFIVIDLWITFMEVCYLSFQRQLI